MASSKLATFLDLGGAMAAVEALGLFALQATPAQAVSVLRTFSGVYNSATGLGTPASGSFTGEFAFEDSTPAVLSTIAPTISIYEGAITAIRSASMVC